MSPDTVEIHISFLAKTLKSDDASFFIVYSKSSFPDKDSYALTFSDVQDNKTFPHNTDRWLRLLAEMLH